MDNKLPAKTAKFTSLKNLYVYGILNQYRTIIKILIPPSPTLHTYGYPDIYTLYTLVDL